ncbi:MAG: hypothetical protein KKB13_18865 [Chloroflexi bacterium]|nr:hypothetical protein [Chloroflexota bacterium]
MSALAELLAWGQAHLAGHNLRIHLLPQSREVRLWIEADQDGRRRTILTDAQGHKLVGVAPLTGAAADIDQAAAHLLAQLPATSNPVDRPSAGSQPSLLPASAGP